jgi:DNA invertase Pin-like site-specific DNA recombinase
MNIVVGYVQSNGEEAREAAEVRALLAEGCQTVRVEAARPADKLFKPVLDAVCLFLGPGDQLVAPDITHLGVAPSSAEAMLVRLEARGVRLRVLDLADPEESLRLSQLRATPWDGPAAATRQSIRRIDPGAVRALSARGFGPSQIARKLGVSRMTVWRKLAAQA